MKNTVLVMCLSGEIIIGRLQSDPTEIKGLRALKIMQELHAFETVAKFADVLKKCRHNYDIGFNAKPFT